MQVTVMLNVADVEASSRWYQQMLGMQSGHGGPDFELLMDGEEISLMLHRRAAAHHPSSPGPGEPVGAGVCVYVRVADIHAIAARATEMGVDHGGVRFNELAHQDELELRDPDGYFLTVCGPASWASPDQDHGNLDAY